MWEDLGGIKFCNTFRVNGLLARDEDACFADVMVCNGKDHVKALGQWELSDKVDCDSLEGQVACRGDWEYWWFCRVGVDFVHLAHGVAFDIGSDKVVHVQPLVVLFNQVNSFGNSRVSGSQRVMKKVCYSPLKIVVFHNNKGKIMV